MATKEVEELSVCSEETNSVCDEERTRKLFQACDTDGDGYIDRFVNQCPLHLLTSSLRYLRVFNRLQSRFRGYLSRTEPGELY